MARKPKAQEGVATIASYVVAADRRVDHDGELYVAGETIELSASAAQPLLDCGAIEPAKPAETPAV